MQNAVKERLKDAAKLKNIPMAKILRDIGLNPGFVTDIGRKGDIPSSDNLMRFADYLNVSVDYLLGRTDNPMVATLLSANINLATEERGDVRNGDVINNIEKRNEQMNEDVPRMSEVTKILSRASKIGFEVDLYECIEENTFKLAKVLAKSKEYFLLGVPGFTRLSNLDMRVLQFIHEKGKATECDVISTFNKSDSYCERRFWNFYEHRYIANNDVIKNKGLQQGEYMLTVCGGKELDRYKTIASDGVINQLELIEEAIKNIQNLMEYSHVLQAFEFARASIKMGNSDNSNLSDKEMQLYEKMCDVENKVEIFTEDIDNRGDSSTKLEQSSKKSIEKLTNLEVGEELTPDTLAQQASPSP